MRNKKYQVAIAESAKLDVKEKKRYILRQFKYREYAESFSNQIKKALLQLDLFPSGNAITGFQYRGYDIYIKPQNGHLLFYTVDEEKAIVTVLRILQDGMDWEYIIKCWIKKNS